MSISANCNVTAPQYNITVWFRNEAGPVARNRPGTYGTTGTGARVITINTLSLETFTRNASGTRLYDNRGLVTRETRYRIAGCC